MASPNNTRTFVLNKEASNRLGLPPQLFQSNHPGIRRLLAKWYADKKGIHIDSNSMDDPYHRFYRSHKKEIFDEIFGG